MLMKKAYKCFNKRCKHMKENKCYNKYLIKKCKDREQHFETDERSEMKVFRKGECYV